MLILKTFGLLSQGQRAKGYKSEAHDFVVVIVGYGVKPHPTIDHKTFYSFTNLRCETTIPSALILTT